MNFEKIIGNNDIIENLIFMVENDKINHALLFDGISGIGKKYAAKILAKSIFCNGENPPCNECSKCIQFEKGTNPDFILIEEENNVIKKESIVGVIDFLSIKPFDSKYKIAIIDGFDKATPEAQNAFLKTLEEGPSYGIIILLSQNSKNILDTVLSRVKIYNFSPIDKYRLVEYIIDRYNIKEEEANFYANFSNGSIGKTIKIINDDSFRKQRKEYIDIFDKALKGQNDYVLSNINLFKDVENLDDVLEMYLTWLRDLYILKKTGKGKYLYNIDYEEKLNSQSHLTFETIDRIKKLIINLKGNLKYNISKDFALDLFFIDILEECQWQKQ